VFDDVISLRMKDKPLPDSQVSTETVGRPVDKVFVHGYNPCQSTPV